MIRRTCWIIRIPLLTVRAQLTEIHHLWDGIDLLKELDAETLGDVPGGVAVEEPGTWVVGHKGHE